MSVAVTEAKFTAGTSEAQLTVSGAGHVIEGGVWSDTGVLDTEELLFAATGSAVDDVTEAVLDIGSQFVVKTVALAINSAELPEARFPMVA